MEECFTRINSCCWVNLFRVLVFEGQTLDLYRVMDADSWLSGAWGHYWKSMWKLIPVLIGRRRNTLSNSAFSSTWWQRRLNGYKITWMPHLSGLLENAIKISHFNLMSHLFQIDIAFGVAHVQSVCSALIVKQWIKFKNELLSLLRRTV